MYRLYNPNSGEHFYTGSETERDNTIKAGWSYEGIGWVAATRGQDVYRLYNPVAGDHHYTASGVERDNLTAVGWQYEGVGWQSAPEESGLAVLREYNPNAVAGAHNYTRSQAEDAGLVAAGWRGEGVAWYALREATSGEMSAAAGVPVDVLQTRGALDGAVEAGLATLSASDGKVANEATRAELTEAIQAAQALQEADSQDAAAMRSAAQKIRDAQGLVEASMLDRKRASNGELIYLRDGTLVDCSINNEWCKYRLRVEAGEEPEARDDYESDIGPNGMTLKNYYTAVCIPQGIPDQKCEDTFELAYLADKRAGRSSYYDPTSPLYEYYLARLYLNWG